MSRRKRKLLIPTVWLDWTPEIAALFRLVPADWTPPEKVRVCGSAHRRTWSARFRTPEGRVNTARLRLERDAQQGWDVVEESCNFFLGPIAR